MIGTRMRMVWIAIASSLLLARPAMGQEAGTMRIRLTIDGKAVEATLLDNATTRDFLSLLPMTLTLEDYASTEKIGYPPRKLSIAGAPAGVDPSVGDIAYYPMGQPGDLLQGVRLFERTHRAGPDRFGDRGAERARLAEGHHRTGAEVRSLR